MGCAWQQQRHFLTVYAAAMLVPPLLLWSLCGRSWLHGTEAPQRKTTAPCAQNSAMCTVKRSVQSTRHRRLCMKAPCWRGASPAGCVGMNKTGRGSSTALHMSTQRVPCQHEHQAQHAPGKSVTAHRGPAGQHQQPGHAGKGGDGVGGSSLCWRRSYMRVHASHPPPPQHAVSTVVDGPHLHRMPLPVAKAASPNQLIPSL